MSKDKYKEIVAPNGMRFLVEKNEEKIIKKSIDKSEKIFMAKRERKLENNKEFYKRVAKRYKDSCKKRKTEERYIYDTIVD